MDAEEIQNRLTTVSQRAFRAIVGILLRDVFGMQAINVDGSGDGGKDWLAFTSDGKRVHVAVQDTTQSTRWREKALADAKTAQSAHGANRYFFCTNRAHHQTTAAQLEDEIARTTGMSATVIEARRMAELIHENSLQTKILDILGEGNATVAPKAPEVAFWIYSNLSADRTDHRNQIFDDTLLYVLYEHKTLVRSDLVDRAAEFLGCAATHRPLLDRRIDALQVGRKIAKSHNGEGLALSEDVGRKLQETEKLYLTDWSSLTGAMTSVLGDYRAGWSNEQAERGAVLLARWFVLEQLSSLRSARATLLPGSWLKDTGDPEQQLRDLLHDCGVPPRSLAEAIGKLVAIARGRPSISKLTRTAVFAALEGTDPLRSSQALGAAKWQDVRILLDASVAIPLLCAWLTEPVDTYLFALSTRAVETLASLGAALKLSPAYLEECAAHLLRATRYEHVESEADFASALKESENAFVAFYYALRSEGRRAPKSLQQFLAIFARNVAEVARITSSPRSIMPDLQRTFSDYHVLVEQTDRVSRLRYEALAKAHDLILAEEGKEKSPILRAHDLAALAHLDVRSSNHRESWMLLTWDRVLIRLGPAEIQSSWIVSPGVAIDFAQPCRKLSDMQWCSLAHRIARVSDVGETLTARILDTIVRLRHELLQDWEFKEEIRRFRDEARERAPVGDDTRLHGWIEKEAAAFISKHGIRAAKEPEQWTSEVDETSQNPSVPGNETPSTPVSTDKGQIQGS